MNILKPSFYISPTTSISHFRYFSKRTWTPNVLFMRSSLFNPPSSVLLPSFHSSSISTPNNHTPSTLATTTTTASDLNTPSTSSTSSSSSSSAFTFTHPLLDQLKKDADACPTNSETQAQLYQALLISSNPTHLKWLCERFENPTYARNDQSWTYYIQALIQLNQTQKMNDPFKFFFFNSPFTPPTSSSSSLASSPLLTSPHQPLYVTLLNPPTSPTTTTHPSFFPFTSNSNSNFNSNSSKTLGSNYTKHVPWALFLLITGAMFVADPNLLPSLTNSISSTTANNDTSHPSSFISSSSSSSSFASNGSLVSLSEIPTTTFNDVAGVEEAKQELKDIVDFLKQPELITKLGGKLPKGILLTGPPGTGKTLLAKAVAGEAHVPFFFMSGSEFDELYVGMGAKRVRELFAQAKLQAPCIIFIDELDAMGGKRQFKDPSSLRQTLNQLLVELDGFHSTSNIIFLAATNAPESLDPALLRPGRFDKQIHVHLPNLHDRIQILKVHLKKIIVDPNLDIKEIARGTPGFSGAELANLVNQAAILASRTHQPYVSLTELDQVKDTLLMGMETKRRPTYRPSPNANADANSSTISSSNLIQEPSTRSITAYHEAGHTLVALYTPNALPLHKVSIVPRRHSLGQTVQLPTFKKRNKKPMSNNEESTPFLPFSGHEKETKKEAMQDEHNEDEAEDEDEDASTWTLSHWLAMMDVALAGRAAEAVYFGSDKDITTMGAQHDLQKAFKLGQHLLQSGLYKFPFFLKEDHEALGMKKAYSDALQQKFEMELHDLIQTSYSRVKHLLIEKKNELDLIAQALLTYETLTAKEVEKVLKGEKIK